MAEESAFLVLLQRTRVIKSDLERRLSEEASAKPEWTASMDVRAAGLQDFRNVLRFVELSLVFIEFHLSSPDWWTRFRGQLPPLREVAFEYTAYSQASKFGALHLGAASFENTVRCLLRALAPGAVGDARKEFKTVYVYLLRTLLQFPEEDITLLELVRVTRNTVHNSGMHRPPKAQSTTIVYRGVEYRFVDGAPIEFVTWAFVLERLMDLQSLLDRIVQAPAVWGHKATLPADWAEAYDPPAA